MRSVFLVGNDDTMVTRTVTVGDRIGSLWIIERGLQAGDRVIVEGLQRVQPDVKVQYTVAAEPELEPAADAMAW